MYLVSSVRRVVRVTPGTLVSTTVKFFVYLVSSRRNNKTQCRWTASWRIKPPQTQAAEEEVAVFFSCRTTARIKVKRGARASGLEAVRQQRSDGGGCMYAFSICWCVVSEVVRVGFCTNCQPMGAAGLSWGLSLSQSLTPVGRMRIFFRLFFFFWETNVSSYFFDAQSSANGSERATDNNPTPPQCGYIDNKSTVCRWMSRSGV